MKLRNIFHEASKEVESLLHFEDIANLGLRSASTALNNLDLIKRANEALERDQHPLVNNPSKFEERRKKAQKLEAWALQQVAPGFPYLYELLLIRLWCILENLIEQVVVSRLRNISALDQHESLARLRIPIFDFMSLDQEERAAFVYEELCKSIGTKERRGAGKFEAVLAAVGLGGSLDDSVSRILLEASVVRNLIIHKGGKTDRRSEGACPWLSGKFGKRISLDSRYFYNYALAVRWYIQEMDRRAGVLIPHYPAINYPASQDELIEILSSLCTDKPKEE
jgi:hypothetical protein